MPTITLYVTEEVKKQLTQVIKQRSKKTGIRVSRGDILSPYIKNLYGSEFPKNGNGKAHIVGQSQATTITGEISGVMAGSGSAVEEVKS